MDHYLFLTISETFKCIILYLPISAIFSAASDNVKLYHVNFEISYNNFETLILLFKEHKNYQRYITHRTG